MINKNGKIKMKNPNNSKNKLNKKKDVILLKNCDEIATK